MFLHLSHFIQHYQIAFSVPAAFHTFPFRSSFSTVPFHSCRNGTAEKELWKWKCGKGTAEKELWKLKLQATSVQRYSMWSGFLVQSYASLIASTAVNSKPNSTRCAWDLRCYYISTLGESLAQMQEIVKIYSLVNPDHMGKVGVAPDLHSDIQQMLGVQKSYSMDSRVGTALMLHCIFYHNTIFFLWQSAEWGLYQCPSIM